MEDNGFIVNIYKESKGIQAISPYGNCSSVTITGTTPETISITGDYLSGDIVFNNTDTVLFGSFGESNIPAFKLFECVIFNEQFPKGDFLCLVCNPLGSATFNYQFSEIIII